MFRIPLMKPFVNQRVKDRVCAVLDSGFLTEGPVTRELEGAFRKRIGCRHALAATSATTGLEMALRAMNIGPGDEVIVPPFTFFASVSSICRLGATPVFADIDPITFNIDPLQIAAKITDRTRAIMPVHLFGQCCDMDAIQRLADAHNLYIVEDAAQSFGAEYAGKRCGGLGAIAAMSFYPTKNLGAVGDAGLVTTDSPQIDKRLRSLRVHGSEVKYYHQQIGYNMRLDAVHAAILRVKLPHVSHWLAQREAAAQRYDAIIESNHLHGFMQRPLTAANRRHVYNQYVVRVPAMHRDALVQHLKNSAVGVEVYYPLCLHQQECFRFLGHRTGDFPASEDAARTVLALPMFPEITAAQQERVVEVCASYLHQSLRSAA